MNKSVSVALLVVGIVLISRDVDALKSFRPDTPSFFTGPPADRTIRILISGFS
ncbi:MAG TPA: DUF3185 family protein [Planctomycetota bacterium]|nr:DUF3185 family protein [Planctomycetota bacterium]